MEISMRTIIAGGRTVTDPKLLEQALLRCGWVPTTVLCGGAKGADALGNSWAESANVPVEMYHADWNTYGLKAGFIRNADMGNNAQALIALWDGESKGTAHMITIAKRLKLKVYVHLVPFITKERVPDTRIGGEHTWITTK